MKISHGSVNCFFIRYFNKSMDKKNMLTIFYDMIIFFRIGITGYFETILIY